MVDPGKRDAPGAGSLWDPRRCSTNAAARQADPGTSGGAWVRRGGFVLAAALAVLLLPGCLAYSRDVTPWLRTKREVPFRLMAESGGAGGYDKAWAERKDGGRWARVPGAGDGAFGFANGTRAVVLGSSLMLLRPDGSTMRLPCDGELRGTPEGAELVCVDTYSRGTSAGAPQTVRVTRLNAEGRAIGRRDVPYPELVPADAPILGANADPSLLGFLPEGLVFAVLVEHGDESYAAGTVKVPRAFLLRADDGWQELGSLRITVSELWALHFPRLWNETNGWHIDIGRIQRDARGEPDP